MKLAQCPYCFKYGLEYPDDIFQKGGVITCKKCGMKHKVTPHVHKEDTSTEKKIS